MADPISLALAIAPIAASLYHMSKSLKKTIKAVANAPQQIRRHTSEITMTRQVFLSVQSSLSSLDRENIYEDEIELVKLVLRRTGATTRTYRRVLRKIRHSAKTGLPTIFGRVQWWLKKESLMLLLKDLDSAKLNMSIILPLIQIKLSKAKIMSGEKSRAEVARLEKEM